MSTEADTCRKYITPALQAAGWDDPPHSIAEQRTFTDGRIVPVGEKCRRLPQKRADTLNRTVQAVLQGKRRILLTMATGTGKTFVAFQIAWKRWSSRWNRTGEHRRPKILYLADRKPTDFSVHRGARRDALSDAAAPYLRAHHVRPGWSVDRTAGGDNIFSQHARRTSHRMSA
jgi:type I site-specific restriction endonuclease